MHSCFFSDFSVSSLSYINTKNCHDYSDLWKCLASISLLPNTLVNQLLNSLFTLSGGLIKENDAFWIKIKYQLSAGESALNGNIMNFAPLQPCAGREQLSLISSIFTSPREMMQWWSWAGKNSASCVPSETRLKGGKQEATGKGWGGGTGLHGEACKIPNFPTVERERRAGLPFTPHPC